ncbi:group II intron reverse transcriptase/maturase [Cetobacterium somerae]|nr:group II intron reverse transcriptase/maturase [Cetobacterium somerae]
MEIISNENNIKLAYRNIKANGGSRTGGTNDKTIVDIMDMKAEDYVRYIQARLKNYEPHEVRRVHIPKGDTGKTRPLGIPTIEDRLLQQCIKQVIEPICEAKFYNHSYGFRPNRGAKHAISRMYFLAQRNKLNYCVDIDIKGFFDNVHHPKLLKQVWSMGIKDKNLLCVIKKMLKAPIENEGIPSKGTPQGGILSPLLSNIVLNELDWWISSQWETKTSVYKYKLARNRLQMLKQTKLKEIYIVRYADDFKIMCRSKRDAKRIFIAVKQWLKERLYLDISEEKSKIVCLNNGYSEFLGFKIKTRKKNNKRVVTSHMSDKAKEKTIKDLKEQVKRIKKNPTVKNINRWNAMVLGKQNYYNSATLISLDFSKIGYSLSKSLHNRLKNLCSYQGTKSETFMRYYGEYNFKTQYISGTALFPIAGIKTRPPMNFSQDICDYTIGGRAKIHTNLFTVDIRILRNLLANPIQGQTNEYNDNRLSLYSGQGGLCRISQIPLKLGYMETHHLTPRYLGGGDEYKNLAFIHSYAHKVIHCTKKETFLKYIKLLAKEIIFYNIDDSKSEKIKSEELILNLTEKIKYYRIKAENFVLN